MTIWLVIQNKKYQQPKPLHRQAPAVITSLLRLLLRTTRVVVVDITAAVVGITAAAVDIITAVDINHHHHPIIRRLRAIYKKPKFIRQKQTKL